jgi:mutator family transposase
VLCERDRGLPDRLRRWDQDQVRDKGAVTTKVAHLVIGIDVEGRKHALGLWIAEAEGAKFLPDAVTSVFPTRWRKPAWCTSSARNDVRLLSGPQEGRDRNASYLHCTQPLGDGQPTLLS